MLSDCLSIAKNKRVMVLDKIESSSPSESKSAYQLMTRKAVSHLKVQVRFFMLRNLVKPAELKLEYALKMHMNQIVVVRQCVGPNAVPGIF